MSPDASVWEDKNSLKWSQIPVVLLFNSTTKSWWLVFHIVVYFPKPLVSCTSKNTVSRISLMGEKCVFFHRHEEEEDIETEGNYSLCEEPLRSKSREEEPNAKPKSSVLSRSRGPKRPDKPLYMPRAVRERLSIKNSQEPSGEQELSSPASSSYSCTSSSPETCSCPVTTENTKSSSSATHDCLPDATDCVLSQAADSPVLCQQAHEAEPQVWDQSLSSFADMTLEEDEQDKEFLSSVPFRDLTDEVSLHVVRLTVLQKEIMLC